MNALLLPIALARYSSKFDNVPKADPKEWSDLVTELLVHTIRERKDGPLWSPVRIKDGALRANENVEIVSALVLDFDQGDDFEGFQEEWSKWEYVVHSTFGHTPEKPKWRAIFPLAEPVEAERWENVYENLSWNIGCGVSDPGERNGGKTDHACSDASRMYYWPSCPPGQSSNAFSFHHAGDILPPTFFPDLKKEEPAPTPKSLNGKAAEGTSPGDDYNLRASWEDVLEPHGWRKTGRHHYGREGWFRPSKRKGHPSVLTGVMNLGDRLYCFSSDPECRLPVRRALLKYAVYALLNFDGDMSAAMKDLKAKGYGSSRPAPVERVPEPSAVEETRTLPDAIERQLRGLPAIKTNNRELRDITAEALDALITANDPPQVFVRSRDLVRIEMDKKGNAQFKPLEKSYLRNALAGCADWLKVGKEVTTHISPPMDVVDDLATLSPWHGIPSVEGLAQCPVIAPDGTCRMTPGYHESAGYYVAVKQSWPEWTEGGEAAAKYLLDDILVDFPFVDPASKANALALMLLPFVRPLIDGPTPLHLVDAPTQGTGKTLLARICLIPGLGPEIHITTVPKDEESWRKTITSALRSGISAMFLDNISRKLDSDALAAVLSSPLWVDRLLGGNELLKIPNLATWVATSNNAKMSSDITRRTVYIRLDAGEENPEDRVKFTHPDIARHVTQNRARIGAACLAMAQEWTSSGMPDGKERMGSYEAWAKIIGGILMACNVTGFLANKEILRERANDEEASWHEFVKAWFEIFREEPVTSKALFEQFSGQEVLSNLLGSGERDDSQKIRGLAKQIGYRLDRIYSHFRIAKATLKDGNRRFKLTSQVALSGFEREISNPIRTHAHDAHAHAETEKQPPIATQSHLQVQIDPPTDGSTDPKATSGENEVIL